jgi:hypothetical protein
VSLMIKRHWHLMKEKPMLSGIKYNSIKEEKWI